MVGRGMSRRSGWRARSCPSSWPRCFRLAIPEMADQSAAGSAPSRPAPSTPPSPRPRASRCSGPLSPDPWVQAEVLAAHDAAVVAALGWLQDHGAVTRRGTDGVDQVDTQGLTAALFRQHTSREVDPQLHTHAIVWAKVQDPTGKWLSLDARFLKQQQRSIGWVYAAALRAELSARLGVSWGGVSEGHADIDGVSGDLLALFSQRNAQVEAKMAELVAAWVDDHDGATPDARTLYRLERDAVLDSRPGKYEPVDAGRLRSEWLARAAEAGIDTVSLPDGQRRLPGTTTWNEEAVIAQALVALASSSSTWLRADLAREIAARLPAEVAGSATGVMRVIDELSERAAARCVELHPPAAPGVACRRDGRPISEHVVDRRLTAPAVLAQEAQLMTWARANVGPRLPVVPGEAQAMAALKVAGDQRLVLVVGPAGAGKTTMLASAVESLRQQGRAVGGPGTLGEGRGRAGPRDRLAGHDAGQAAARAPPTSTHRSPSGSDGRERPSSSMRPGWPRPRI